MSLKFCMVSFEKLKAGVLVISLLSRQSLHVSHILQVVTAQIQQEVLLVSEQKESLKCAPEFGV